MGTFYPQGLKGPLILPRKTPEKEPFYYTDLWHDADISHYYTSTRIGTTGGFVRRRSPDGWLEWEVTQVGAIDENWGVYLDIGFKDFILRGDFEILWEIRWEEKAISDIQYIRLILRDIGGVDRAQIGFQDGWVAQTGRINAWLCGINFDTGINSMPLVGSMKLRLLRKEGMMYAYYFDTLLNNQVCSQDLPTMRLQWYTNYNYNSLGLKGGINYVSIEK